MKAEVMQATLAGGAGKADERAGKYLTFQLGNEEFAIQVLKVREIMGVQEITAVPQTPVFVKGVINLRGKVIPVVDLRLKFGLPEAAYTQRTCIIVVQVPGERGAMLMGIVVDGVSDVLNLTGAEIENTPDFGQGVTVPYLLGMAKTKGGVKILLDIDQVLTSLEVRGLEAVLKQK
jgi:purine-binding chemotaxis protein CheW